MAENSTIEWTDHTFSPWIGCTKVSPGCDNCYAEHLMDTRLHKVVWGVQGERVRTSAATWREPIRWNARHAEFFAAHGRRQRVFCASLADVFDNVVDPAWRADLFTLIERTPNLDWLLLTKRIGNVMSMVGEAAQYQFDLDRIEKPRLHDNIWLGATIVNQEEADRDIPKLLAVPARVRFLSMEPLLGPVDLTRVMRSSPGSDWSYCDDVLRGFRAHKCGGHISPENAVNWVIVGGESGANARPMHPEWARDLRDQCAAAGVPFLFKQWGEWAPGENCGGPPTRTERVADWFCDEWSFSTMTPSEHDGLSYDDEPTVYRVGKKTAGRHLDGRTHDDFPEAR
ncbi:phage Gp37/Gp68 family protein [Burkholderia sp. BCCIQ04A]|uniref:Phage Gp37/Gp68 family protein n=1 Tax=Burkholderia anthinoferrum TaxID=3090833 RepID=A0ABU5WTB7_9BURK|nr:phage Gp37/Gp68 family protein [Burkholderia anthinoferrum]MEB2535846.1 phage Gp37/Gp68 family protein [Burkholderia anthinoferrum]MEB2561974.1 phage Gp37/Gp68 family protein [Burkholderia anthinoferrum]MEB2582275.1 phage Gp37/Gp68 family protein [Burkholderia anthinoferrum]MEB2632600.1 phage Gp37/Gp68 family protein [Burkholderia anthinoferrum]